MKKLLVLFTVLYFFSLQNITAQNENSLENTTWNVIRERLFNGENSQIFRYEDDIRFQVIGAKTYQDSAIFNDMIAEFNDLLDIAQIKMVNENPNFKLKITEEHGKSSNSRQITSGYEIVSVNLEIGFDNSFVGKESVNRIYYYTIRQLTKIYEPQHGHTGYNGIFDSDEPKDAEFQEIDKNVLKKIYSKDFYKQLKENTTKTRGYQFYLNLRFKNLIRNIFLSIKIILIIFGFLYFLSKESKRSKHPPLLLYIKQRTIILLIIPFIFSYIKKSGDFTALLIVSPLTFVANFIVTVINALLVLILIYYTEPYFLKKMDNFVSKQSFIFLSTIVSVLIIQTTLGFLLMLLSNSFVITQFNPASFWTQNTTNLFIIAFIAGLRVFYNFLNYHIQSMVNQKDVELARMKELKNQAELNALHSRINPHFLYNSLNSIAGLAHSDPDKTEKMATSLSSLFRYSINKEEKTYATVNEELEMVQKYLEVEKVRFGKKLDYNIEIDKELEDKQIPKFIIQPLVENAVKHGLSKITGVGKVKIEIRKETDDLIIRIFDNGPDFPDEPVRGYGLQNLHDKLQILYGDDAVLNWQNGENKNIQVTLKNQF